MSEPESIDKAEKVCPPLSITLDDAGPIQPGAGGERR